MLLRPPAVVLLAGLSALVCRGDSGPQAVCAACHKAESEAQPKTPMASALSSAADCEILRQHPNLSFSDGAYKYQIVRQGNSSIYRVTDGKDTITVPLQWAFGLGAAGQTYVFERNGKWVESRVSYYRAVNGLDVTLGAVGVRPANLEDAAGRVMSAKDSRECFDCHATHASTGGQLDVSHLAAGIGCERCHEQAEEHAAQFRSGSRSGQGSSAGTPRAVGSLGHMSAEEVSNFCGQCHRTWAQIAAEGPFGIGNIRFQPYRLTNSACYDAADRRISCTACHDPHRQSAAATSSYDSKCLACHAPGRHPQAKRCTVGKQDCAGCHMPKLELPGSHHQFTDHQIRVVKAGAKYPN